MSREMVELLVVGYLVVVAIIYMAGLARNQSCPSCPHCERARALQAKAVAVRRHQNYHRWSQTSYVDCQDLKCPGR